VNHAEVHSICSFRHKTHSKGGSIILTDNMKDSRVQGVVPHNPKVETSIVGPSLLTDTESTPH
jgi:hypothetical protein